MKTELTPLETCPHCKALERANEAKEELDLSQHIGNMKYYGFCDNNDAIINAFKKIQDYLNKK